MVIVPLFMVTIASLHPGGRYSRRIDIRQVLSQQPADPRVAETLP